MWLINSSIGRKVVMSVTGIALILFLTFHGCMNVVALFSGDAYNMICELLGANWYAVVATLGLAALAVCPVCTEIHFSQTDDGFRRSVPDAAVTYIKTRIFD